MPICASSKVKNTNDRASFGLAQFGTFKDQGNKMQKITALVLLALCTAGCATAGTKANPSAVASFQPGVTTLDQAEARLGQPYSVSRTADASTIVAYSFTNDQDGGSNHRTFISAFVDDTDGNKDMVALNFDKGSKFVSSTLTQSTTSAGLFSQK